MRQLVVAVALFIGIGFITRRCFRQWMESAIDKASADSKIKAAEWRPVQTNFSDLKFKPFVNPVPLYRPKESPNDRPRSKPRSST